MPSETQLTTATRDELLRLARDRGVPGRSRMSKEELVAALRAREQPAPVHEAEPPGAGRRQIGSRVEAFRRLAEARAAGEMVLIPRMLAGNDRRVHVRETVREDHETRIASGDLEARAKFDKLAGSVFHFFRGTNLLFYRDLVGEDARLPTVLALGDVHPGNFGVMPSSDNVPVFGVNDFDDAYYAPFTWDLKRGAVGFLLGAAEKGGHGPGKQRAVAERFVRGYVSGIASYASDGREETEQLRMDNAPRLIRDLIAGTLETGRADWLGGLLEGTRRGFRTDEELVPVSSRREEFQEVVDRYVAENEVPVPERAGAMRVKDVAERRGAGTASLGLTRYYVLIAGVRDDGTDDLLLEFKRARRSALSGLVPPSGYEVDGQADRIRHAQRVHLVSGDVFYGSVDIDGQSFMVRERAPYRGDVGLGSLSTGGWKRYAEICGRVLAHTHAMSDETGNVDYDVEPAILDAIGNRELFVDDVLRWAGEAADRVRQDHAYFRADHALGAFRSVDVVYR
ncbi:DUF2252 domain-containing protein [Blastococcus sp. MG754426]|uniref:DUF2252 family protein n=1 Tax=unclassified Blastococcus TaxID=2619396 RepID=UPI001EF02C67|nr:MULTISPECIES: DUF2252 family protein [unclassified Blastococcus]MCF6509577.1 DUF2252 domain-containing protein [Blastococcus sp. MG754426]MCF6514237.1 DUF2252 domain-containing protein [Blastococcus sp. MG754427]